MVVWGKCLDCVGARTATRSLERMLRSTSWMNAGKTKDRMDGVSEGSICGGHLGNILERPNVSADSNFKLILRPRLVHSAGTLGKLAGFVR